MGRAAALDGFGEALKGQARMGERIALAGLAGQQGNALVGLERPGVGRERRDENDRRAVRVGSQQHAADGGKMGLRIDDGERDITGRPQEAAGKPARLVVGFANHRRLVRHGFLRFMRCRRTETSAQALRR